MAGRAQDQEGKLKRNSDFLLHLVEAYKLFHIKTFHYNDLRGVLGVISESRGENFVPQPNRDTLAELERYMIELNRSDVQLVAVHSAFQLYQGTKYVLVYIKDQPTKPNSIVAFMNAKSTAPCSHEASALVAETKRIVAHKASINSPLLPIFSSSALSQEITPSPQCDHPVLDVHQPERYTSVSKPRMTPSSRDSFNREYVDSAQHESPVQPWEIYSGIPADLSCSTDIEKLTP